MLQRLGLFVLLAAGVAASAATVVNPLRSGEGLDVYRITIALGAPADERISIDGGAVLAWNEAGRLVHARRVDAAEFGSWTGRRQTFQPGQDVIFSRREVFQPELGAARLTYVFAAQNAAGQKFRLLRQYALGHPIDGLATRAIEPTGVAKLELKTSPDKLEGVRLERSGRELWGFSLWAQETGGVPVTLTGLEWAARSRDGQVIANERLDQDALRKLLGVEPLCGPDSYLVIGGRKISADATQRPVEIVAMLNGTTPDGQAVSALARCPLELPVPRPASTLLRLPFKGDWRVARGPGEGVTDTARLYTWVFEKVDGKGHAHRGDGGSPSDYYGYGEPVLAPANGIIAGVMGFKKDADQPLTNGDFAGGSGPNYVVIDHGNNEYSYLGGLRRDAIRARFGASIQMGEEIGRLGNTCLGSGRPALTFRLSRGTGGGSLPITLSAHFLGYTLLSPGGPAGIETGSPETGDIVRAP